MRHLLHLPHWTLRLLLGALAVLAFAFVVLTRTEVGRQGVRVGLEQAFSQQFNGTLQIERLTGNLAQTLYAGKVTVRDATGMVMLEADSVIFRPAFGSLFSRTLTLRSIDLIRPTLLLRRDSAGWNVTTLMRAPPDTARDNRLWRFNSAAIRVHAGTVLFDVARPSEGQQLLWDYTSMQLDSLDAVAEVAMNGPRRRVILGMFKGNLRNPALPIEMSGDWQIAGATHTLDAFALQVGNSTVRGAAQWAPSEHNPFKLTGKLDLSELHAFFPRLPLEQTLAVEVHGLVWPGAAEFDRFILSRGESRLTASGTLRWPETRLQAEQVILDAELRRADLLAVWPGAPQIVQTLSEQSRLRLTGSAALEHSAAGALTSQVRYAYAGAVGQASGTARLAHLDGWRVEGDARLQRLLVARLDPRLAGTDLSGLVQGVLRMRKGQPIYVNTTLDLGPSRLLGRAVDSLAATVSLADDAIALNGVAQQGGGTWQFDIQTDPALYHIAGAIESNRTSLRAVAPNSPFDARFDGHARVDLKKSAETFYGGTVTLALTPLTLARDSLRLSLQHLDASIELDQDGHLRAQMDSDAAHADLTAQVDPAEPLRALRHWTAVAAEAIRERTPASRDALLLPPDLDAPPLPTLFDPLRADLAVEIQDERVLAILAPGLEKTGTGTAHLHLRGTQDMLEITGEAMLHAPRLSKSSSRDIQARIALTLRKDTYLAATLDLSADTLRAGALALPDATLRTRLEDRQAQVSLQSLSGQNTTTRFAARAAFNPDVIRVTVDTLDFQAGPYQLQAPAAQIVQVYRDGIAVPGFTMYTPGSDAAALTLRGALSPAVSDTLFARVQRLPLAPVTSQLGPRFQFGGDLSADLALTGVFGQPELTGALDIPALTWGGFVVGDVHMDSYYTPGIPDVSLDVGVRPVAEPPPGVDVRSNTLQLGGTFRLPGRRDGQHDEGNLNLTLHHATADAFFFDILFPNLIKGAAGRIDGTGRIAGTLRRPVFEATASVREARFILPAFNLAYTASASARVDATGIHVLDGSVTDTGAGRATVRGSLLFNDYRFFSLDVTASLDRLLLLNVADSPDLAFYGILHASGDARLTGPLSGARLRSTNAVLTENSQVFIPIRSTAAVSDPGYIIFADSTGRLPDVQELTRRTSVIGKVEAERTFTAGLDMDLDLRAPPGVTVNLVTDPLAGDIMRAVGSGRVQLVRRDGDFQLFGTLDVTGGDYLFTAGELFVRRFDIRTGSLVWDGDPLDPRLDVQAQYATRASLAGLPYPNAATLFVPLFVRLAVQDRLSSLAIGLRLELDRNDRGRALTDLQEIEQVLNQPDRQAEYATSVLLTNSFLLTTTRDNASAESNGTLASTGNYFAFASLSQLVASQLNRYLAAVLPAVDFNLGLQGERARDLDVTYGVALRLLDERLVIRGAGLLRTDNAVEEAQGLQGEFVVEVRLTPSISVEVFYRREQEDVLQPVVTSSTGAGLSYKTQFTSWRAFWMRLLGHNAKLTRLAAELP